jgi:DNA-binding beta-propeller fold protein YncE
MRNTSIRKQALTLLLVVVEVVALAGCGGSGSDGLSAPPPPSGSLAGYAYVASADAQGLQVPGAVYQFTIGADGSLSPLASASVPTGVTPTAMVSDPSGQHVYVLNLADATISQYAVTAGGGLAPLSVPSISIKGSFTQASGYFASVDPTGRFLYVVANPPPVVDAIVQYEAFIAQYFIGGDGSLRPLTPSYVLVPSTMPGALAIDAGGQHAYLAGGSAVYPFALQADGTLSIMTPVTATPTATGVALAPGGQFAYVLSRCIDTLCEGQLALYTVDTGGQLAPTGVTTLLGSHILPLELEFEADGKAGYLLTDFMGVDTNTGSLTRNLVETNGMLVGDALVMAVPLGGSPVTEILHGGDVYALISSAMPGRSSTGGQVLHYSSDLRAVGSTNLAAGLLTAMTMVSR